MPNKKTLITGGSGFIGTNYIEYLLRKGDREFLNLDNRPPRNSKHKPYWIECDLMDAERLRKIIKDFAPAHVVHLAATTGADLRNLTLDYFAPNIKGVENLVVSLRETPSVERAIFTSTMLVCEMGYIPKCDTDYKPSTLYGESKVYGEQVVRAQKNLNFFWTITRPIGIWGPWGEEPYLNLFKAIRKGWYVHPGHGHYKRNLGYVENTVHQMECILSASEEKIAGKTMYLSDGGLVDLHDFAEEIQKVMGVRKIGHIPLWLIKAGAKLGDVLKTAGWRNVPLTTFRLKNMTCEYSFDLLPIMEISAPLPFSWQEGVKRTIDSMS